MSLNIAARTIQYAWRRRTLIQNTQVISLLGKEYFKRRPTVLSFYEKRIRLLSFYEKRILGRIEQEEFYIAQRLKLSAAVLMWVDYKAQEVRCNLDDPVLVEIIAQMWPQDPLRVEMTRHLDGQNSVAL